MKLSTLFSGLVEVALYAENKDLEILDVVTYCLASGIQDLEADDMAEYQDEIHSLLDKEDYAA